MQAQEYEQVYRSGDFDEFQGLSTKITSVEGQRLLELLRKERQAQRLKEAQRYPIVFLLGKRSCIHTFLYLLTHLPRRRHIVQKYVCLLG